MKSVLVGALILILAAIGFSHYVEGERNSNPYFRLSKILEDGSQVYFLVDPGEDQARGTDDDDVWALRFPADFYVRNFDEDRIVDGEAIGVKWTYNDYISFSLKLPGLGNVTRWGEDVLTVGLSARSVPYGDGTFRQFDPSFSSRQDLNSNILCRRDREVSPGLFILRELTEPELIEGKRKYASDLSLPATMSNARCGDGIEASRYAYYDGGKILGGGFCRQSPIRGQQDSCFFTFWMEPGRQVRYIFSREYLFSIGAFHKDVSKIILEASDLGYRYSTLNQ